ncbi:META domain-containing protein [Novosphingobium sp. ZW T3_23]|uniref:META domain-containing protein n=1 Tax=Novosphingobium sp. ZW T3_23 TaxID=3378084 RepID=UPI00385367D7
MIAGVLASVLALATAVAPVGAAHASDRMSNRMPGSRWEVLDVDGERAPRRSKAPAATLFMVADGTLGGTSECNSGGSAYMRWTKAGAFTGTDGPIIFTAMGCPVKDGTNFAARFWQLMGNATRWERAGKLLTIRASDGTTAQLRLMSEVR